MSSEYTQTQMHNNGNISSSPPDYTQIFTIANNPLVFDPFMISKSSSNEFREDLQLSEPMETRSSSKLRYYLLAVALLHLLIGVLNIIFEIILTIMMESLFYPGIWMGSATILFGVHMLMMISKSKSSMPTFKLTHLLMIMFNISALILSSISTFEYDQQSLWISHPLLFYRLKLALIILLAYNLFQLCLTSFLSCVFIEH